MKVYAFDVDECLWTSNGPVTEDMLRKLRAEGHILGICGNLSAFIPRCPTWHEYVSFTTNFDLGLFGGNFCSIALNYGIIPKAIWLMSLKQHVIVEADDYVMVGNIKGQKNALGVVCNSEDNVAAEQAGWRFIKEDDFANGVR